MSFALRAHTKIPPCIQNKENQHIFQGELHGKPYLNNSQVNFKFEKVKN